MTTTPGFNARGTHVWLRDVRKWDVYFGLVLVVTELSFALSHGPRHGERLAAAALLFAALLLYLLVGGPSLRDDPEDSRRAFVYVGCAGALFVPAAILDQQATIVMFAFGPQCFMMLSIRKAMLTLAVCNLTPLLGWGVIWHDDYEGLLQIGVITVLVTAFSLAFGGWVQRIVDQSRDRADLIRQLDESRDEVARLSAAHGALSERERLAREIHDTLAQGFTSLVMLSQAVESELDRDPEQARRHVELIKRTARDNLAESRALIAALTPAQLNSASLEEAVRRLVERLGEELGMTADLRVRGEPRRLPPAVEVVGLRTCQEALANIRKHAYASDVAVALTYHPDALELLVTDDGRGFDPETLDGGYGLPGMRARAAEIGGTATVYSAPGAGTALTVRLPIANDTSAVTGAAQLADEAAEPATAPEERPSAELMVAPHASDARQPSGTSPEPTRAIRPASVS